MSTRSRRAASLSMAAAVGAVLAGCAGTGGDTTSGLGLCAEIESRANAAFRQNFLTEYSAAERAWTDILTLYDAEPEAVADCTQVPPRSIVLANLGLVYSNQRNFTAAGGTLQAASKAAQETGGEGLSGRTRIYEALHELNQSAFGAETLARAEAASITLGDSAGLRLLETEVSASVLQLSPQAQRQLIEEGVNLAGLAFAYLSRNDTRRALGAIDEALVRVAPIDGAAGSYVPRFRVTRAEALLAAGREEAALAEIERAIAGYGADMRRSALVGRAEAVHGRILADLGRDEAALAAFQRGFAILRGTPVRVSYDLLHPYVALTERMVAAAPARREALLGGLFRDMQAVRSQVTASSISLAAAARAEGTGPLAAAVRDYNRASEELALVVAQKLLVEGRAGLSTPEAVGEVNRRFEAARAREAEAIEALIEIDPEYFDRLSGEASLAEVQAALGPSEAYVQIALGDPESLVFVVRRDSVDIATPDRLSLAETRDIVGGLRNILRTGFIYAPNESYRLYQAFIEPMEGALAGADTLVFSLSDALTVIPMEVLARRRTAIDDLARLEDFTDVDWMGAAYDISYVPSPRNLVDLRAIEPASAATRPVLAYGDFRPGADVDTILDQSFLPEECRSTAELISALAPLPGTAAELQSLAGIFPGATTVAADAFTEDAVTGASADGTLAQYRVLHFATHGILPNGDCIRRPALSVSAAGVAGSDGLLTDVEIRRLDIAADLVVMSACDTAGGVAGSFDAAGGEALSGLARAFFDAGTAAVLATHWPVFDQQTAQVVTDFYTALERGERMAPALRAAQARIRENPATSDPLFWGAFVLIGDADRAIAFN
ncbi:MAG: CHAT domain-containing protein [Pseudomonadota bacterium]